MTFKLKKTTPKYSTTKGAKKAKAFKEFDKWHKTLKKSPSVVSKVAKKAGKFFGGKTLGVLGMLGTTSSKADQPNLKKGDIHYRDPKKSIF